MERLYNWLLLKAIRGLGEVSIKRLWLAFGSAEDILSASYEDLREMLGEERARAIKRRELSFEPEEVIRLVEREGIGWVCLEDEAYPTSLKEIEDPPPVLFYRGEIRQVPMIGIVGTRKPDSQSLGFIKSLVREVVSKGYGVWGNIMDGLIKYQIGVFDGRWDHVNPNGVGVRDNLAFAGRIQFTPTMLGYKAEKGFTLADTYLGKQNVLSIGLGYNSQKWDNGAGRSGTAKAWTVDAMWEQKFGDIVPNSQLGYQDRKDMPAATLPGQVEDRAYYVQGQLLFDQVVGLGKPALAIRYEKLDDRTANNLDTDRVGVFLNYYIKGQDAKIQFGADVVSLKNKNVDNRENYTDWTLALQTQF